MNPTDPNTIASQWLEAIGGEAHEAPKPLHVRVHEQLVRHYREHGRHASIQDLAQELGVPRVTWSSSVAKLMEFGGAVRLQRGVYVPNPEWSP